MRRRTAPPSRRVRWSCHPQRAGWAGAQLARQCAACRTGTLCSVRTLVGLGRKLRCCQQRVGVLRIRRSARGRATPSPAPPTSAPSTSAGPPLSLDDACCRGPDEVVAMFSVTSIVRWWRAARGVVASGNLETSRCLGRGEAAHRGQARRSKRLGTERLNESREGGDGWPAD